MAEGTSIRDYLIGIAAFVAIDGIATVAMLFDGP